MESEVTGSKPTSFTTPAPSRAPSSSHWLQTAMNVLLLSQDMSEFSLRGTNSEKGDGVGQPAHTPRRSERSNRSPLMTHRELNTCFVFLSSVSGAAYVSAAGLKYP